MKSRFTEKIIVALDVATTKEALRLISLLSDDVGVLTSSTDETLAEIGIAEKTSEHVLRLAGLGVASGIDGLVASPHEARMLRAEFGDKIKIVTPGIRPAGSAPGDQKRFATPREAIDSGADYLVIGRPITASADPKVALHLVMEELAR